MDTQYTRWSCVKSNGVFLVLLWMGPWLQQAQPWLSWGSESLSPPFVCVLGVTEHVVLRLGILVWWPAQSSCFQDCHPHMWALRKPCFCCLLPPYSLSAVLAVLYVCELLKEQKPYAWKYGGLVEWFIVMYAHCFLFLNIYFDGLYFITEKTSFLKSPEFRNPSTSKYFVYCQTRGVIGCDWSCRSWKSKS